MMLHAQLKSANVGKEIHCAAPQNYFLNTDWINFLIRAKVVETQQGSVHLLLTLQLCQCVSLTEKYRYNYGKEYELENFQ